MTSKTENDFLDVFGKKTQLMRGGSGPPLVYLHSASGETEWLPFHERLGQHFEVNLPAHPGFALSQGLEQIKDMQDLAWHYVDLFTQLGWKQVPIVGFSLGAWIGLELAIVRPELVSKLILIASAGVHLRNAPIAEIFRDDFEELRNLVFFDPAGDVAQQAIPHDHNDPRILLWLRAREATARVGWNPYLHNPKLPQHFRRIECPVRVIWGREDRLIPLAHGEYFAANLPQASLEVFDECGHMVPLEMPDRCADSVLDFLA